MKDGRSTRRPRTHAELTELLQRAAVHPDVVELRPDYRVLLVAADGIRPAPSDDHSESLLRAAEDHARTVLEQQPVDQLPHVAAWRDAYRAFGAKPQRTRNSLEALLRRTPTGLPRVNQLTDTYNAISITHSIPLGGEDLDHYDGPPRLLRATGTEAFLTTANGVTITEHPDVGEVVWADDAGVTCRRWNWRQTTRTQLRDTTTAALFILDALAPCTDDDLHHAANDLMTQLRAVSPDLVAAQRLIAAGT